MLGPIRHDRSDTDNLAAARNAGIDGLLLKPFSPEAVARTIEGLLAKPPVVAQHGGSSAGAAPPLFPPA